MQRDKRQRPKVVSFQPDARNLESRIRDLAKDSKNILWAYHARERMEERGFVVDDVLRVLRSGLARGAPEMTDQGEWKVKMTYQIKGAREAGVVTIILHSARLFIKTVEWEDSR